MSLELHLERIAVALEAIVKHAAGDAEAVVTKAVTEVTKGRKAKAVDPTPAAASPTPPTASATASASTASTAEPVTGKQVTDAILDVAHSVSRDSAVAILAKYGAKACSELKPEDWARALADALAAKAAAVPKGAAATSSLI